MIWNDEIVDEVRKVRDEHAAKFDYDISAICADIRKKQIESRRKVVANKTNFEKESAENFDLLHAA